METKSVRKYLTQNVLSSTAGDYFGILKDSRVTGFPFNICENPMYTGCTLSFLGTALW